MIEYTVEKVIREERDFLHDLSNKLVIAHGMTSFVQNALNKAQGNPEIDEKWLAKLEKSTRAMEQMINMIKDRRNHLIKITEDEKAKNS